MIADSTQKLMPHRVGAIAVLLTLGTMTVATAQGASKSDPIAALGAEIAALRADYEARIERLEARLADLEARAPAPRPEPSSQPEVDELAALREAARQAAGPPEATVSVSTPAAEAPVGRERNLNVLNPEISATGIVVGNSTSEDREEFEAQEFEIDIQAALDPFSRTRFTLAVREDGVELEEGYLAYSSLPGGLELLIGRFRQRFGPLNRQHLHALPQSDYPLVYQAFFGDEGLGQTGLSFNWLLPRPWATANEITLEITDGENEVAFAGEEFEDFSVLGRVKNFWQLSDATYFEWGLSGIAGKTATDADSAVYGIDFTISWQPPGRTKYRGLTWRLELLQSERDDEAGVSRDLLGGYTYLEGLVARNLYVGARFDRVENPPGVGGHDAGIVPYLTWWQSEYVRLRAEYGLFELGPDGESEDRFTLQLTWAAGPHKHQTY